jgi:hydrogenase nickel incorporation protein HypA/HybF
MHETMIAQSVFQAVLEQARKLNARPISAKVSCGQLSPINEEVMNFAFDIAAKGTVCEGMTLEIVQIPLKATCEKCGGTFELDIYSAHCMYCGGTDFNILPDAPLLLEEIEFEDKQTDEGLS